MLDKYCPKCGAIWVYKGATCSCNCDPVAREQLKVRPVITKEARKYLDFSEFFEQQPNNDEYINRG